MEQIRLQDEAAQYGLSGLSYGTSQHQFITTRMEDMGKLHEELTRLVGPEQAIKMLDEAWEKAEV